MKVLVDVDQLKNLIKEKVNKDGVIHDRGNIEDILPFTSTKTLTVVRKRFPNVLGEFTRNITNLRYEESPEKDPNYFEEDPIISKIASKVETNDNADVALDLKLFLETYLYRDNNEIKQIHPYMFNYYPLSSQKKQKNEEINVAKFMADILVDDTTNLKVIFENTKGESILTTLVLENLAGLKEGKERKKQYPRLITTVSQLFKEDFLFLSKHSDYFLTHYPLLVQYYYFLYVSQLAWKFSLFNEADYTVIDPFYYALDWESINKRRKAADVGGYKSLKERCKVLFVHVHAMSQLSYNTLNENFKFMTYNDLEEASSAHRSEFVESIYDWIEEYHKKAQLKRNIVRENSLKKAFEELYKCLKEGMNEQAIKRYGEGVEDAAVGKFLKSRGTIGYTLNLTQDFLLLLTAVCVKDQRIPLVKLFEEFEKRGVKLDRYSTKEVIGLLDNLNIIDKKSDSGDAHYVKPIL